MPSVSGGVALKADPAVVDLASADLLGKAGDSQSIHPGERDVTCGRGHVHHGEFGAAGVLIRHKGDDGKVRYLLQKRSAEEDDPGTWSLPGGALLAGETALQGAFREAQEEMGPFPPSVSEHHHVVDDHGDGWAFTTIVCDTPEMFHPDLANSETPGESSGFGWFTREEIGDLPLHPGFKDAWEAVIRTRKNTELGKCVMRRVGLNGQEFWSSPDPCPCHSGDHAAGGGGPEFMPHDAEGIQHGRASGSRGGGTAGHYDDGGVVHPAPPSPEWEDDGEYPHERGVPPAQGGGVQGYQGGYWPEGGHGTAQAGTWQPTASAPRGVGKGESLTDTEGAVTVQLAENFPPSALEWLPHAEWSGPSLVPLKLVDFHDMTTWSAYSEPDRVAHFRHLIETGEEFNPVVLIKVPGHKKYRVVDGHHRAMAYRKLGQPVRAWIGVVPFGVAHIAEETHSSQYHQGSSKENE
jgi:8-oxo-dGTP pyrophosphatase MutT (NUDIX family)